MKAAIMRAANALCDMLENCNDGCFVDIVCSMVSCNDRFTDEEIEAEAADEEV